jgi:glycerate-2-kinase
MMLRLDRTANVLEREAADSVRLDVGACEHGSLDLGLLRRIEAARTARTRLVVETWQAFRVEALDRIAQRLIGHAREPGRLVALVVVEFVGNRHHAPCRPPLAFLAGGRATRRPSIPSQ